MIDLNLDRDTITRILQRIENEYYAKNQNELLPYGSIDIQQATDNVLGQLEIVRAEPTERYRFLRLKQVYHGARNDDYSTFLFAKDDDRLSLQYLLESRYLSLTAAYFDEQVIITELHPKDVGTKYNDLKELEHFEPQVYNDAIIKEWTYQDWELGVEFITPGDRSKGQVWGVTCSSNSPERLKESGKGFNVSYISKTVANMIEQKQKEIGEQYVVGNLAAYRSHFQKIADKPLYTIPTLDDLRELYKKAAHEPNFAAASVPVFTKAGKQRAVAIGATYSIGPRKWSNEWLDWYTWISGSDYQKFYHFVTPSMIDARNVSFVQGDAEALFRFCQELEGKVTTVEGVLPILLTGEDWAYYHYYRESYHGPETFKSKCKKVASSSSHYRSNEPYAI